MHWKEYKVTSLRKKSNLAWNGKDKGWPTFLFLQKENNQRHTEMSEAAHSLTTIGRISHQGGYHRPMGQDASAERSHKTGKWTHDFWSFPHPGLIFGWSELEEPYVAKSLGISLGVTLLRIIYLLTHIKSIQSKYNQFHRTNQKYQLKKKLLSRKYFWQKHPF